MVAGPGGSQAASESPPSTVCCMCGDLGLPEELFRCKDCLFRFQHRYCSELYPRAEACRSCNWCLKEEQGKSIAAGEPMSDGSSSSSSSPASDALNRLRLQRGVPLLQLCMKPVKKLRATVEGSPASRTPDEKGMAAGPLAGSGRVRQAFKGKVRRYKLLEEVSS